MLVASVAYGKVLGWDVFEEHLGGLSRLHHDHAFNSARCQQRSHLLCAMSGLASDGWRGVLSYQLPHCTEHPGSVQHKVAVEDLRVVLL